MAHFFTLNENKLDDLNILFKNKTDNQYCVLNSYGKYSDIAQYSKKYDNIKLVCVLTDNLDYENGI